MIRIVVTSVFVDDQQKALDFYTEVLGFVKKNDIPLGEARWLTVVSPDGSSDVELLLEPNGNPAAKAYQEGIYQQGIPATTFATDDIWHDYERMSALGVKFTLEPSDAGTVTLAIFDDTCGNLISLHQPLSSAAPPE